MNLGQVETGNSFFIEAVFTATRIAPTAQSSAVTFTVVDPAGDDTVTSSPNAAIAAVVVTDAPDGRKVSTWVLTVAALTLPGRYHVRARSTAGLLASQNSYFDVPAYLPLASA